jgi:hypothetical protein
MQEQSREEELERLQEDMARALSSRRSAVAEAEKKVTAAWQQDLACLKVSYGGRCAHIPAIGTS